MVARGNEESFRILFEPHRRSITLHCYRMLGSLHDAEEIVQETLLRAWQRQDEVRSAAATRAWLYKIATNACLDVLKTRRRRAASGEEHLGIEPAPDTLLELADDAALRPDARVSLRESVGLAFITALQVLSPRQRAALLLVDVLGWKPEETAALVGTSVASVNSLLQRARKSVEARSEAPSVTDDALLRRFITAWESGDLEAFANLLSRDAILSMPPQPEWFTGPEAIHRFFANAFAARPRQYRLLPIAANGGPAVALYNRTTGSEAAYQPAGVTLLTMREGRIARMTRFSPTLFPRFELPAQLHA